MKEKSIKFKDYINYKYPEYANIKVVPTNSIRNYSTDKILNVVNCLYKSIDNRVKLTNNKLFFECDAKASYYIYIEKNKVEFYFIVPKSHYLLFKDKIIDAWKNKISLFEVDELPCFSNSCLKYYLTYSKEDALSLNCDRRTNELLGGVLNTLHIMQDDDKCGILYNFSPYSQKQWRPKYDRTIEKLKCELPINKNKYDIKYIGIMFVLLIANIVDIAISVISPDSQTKLIAKKDLCITKNTIMKRESNIVCAQILCASESHDKDRELNNAISLCQAFECLDSDNKLIYNQLKKEGNLFEIKSQKIKISTQEGRNMVSLPGRELLEEHNAIEHTDVLESPVPEKLKHGYISLGFNKYKDTYIEAFLRDNYDQGNFPLVLIGEQGSGKTTYISNYVKYIQSRNEGCIVIDYIKNCELSESIKHVTPKKSLIELDFSDADNLQGIGYNELKPRSNKPEHIIDIANRKALYVSTLIDAINVDGEPLSTSMDRYLNAASNVVLLYQNACLKDVVSCLNDHKYRNACIDNIPKELSQYLQEEINALLELNETDKKGEINGTKTSKVDGINHRINLLRKDFRLKMMFNKSCANNIDLVSAMDEGKIILIKMPQEYFSTPYSKNVIVTYLFTKIWASTLVRGAIHDKPKRFHSITDEIFQSKTAMKLIREQEIAPQTRKFGLKFVFSCQNLKQIDIIDQTLRSAGTSYMLMKGSGKANFDEFKDELSPYTLSDLESLPQYSSLNLINYEGGRAKFVTKLPRP